MASRCTGSVWVVGGGFTGIMIASALARMGVPVCLHEAAGALGGVMEDDEVLGAPRMSGCHVIQADLEREARLHIPAREHLIEVENCVESETYFGDQVHREINCEGPVTMTSPTLWKEFKFGDFEMSNSSFASRIQRYPPELRQELTNWSRSLGVDSGDTWADSMQGFQMLRVYYPNFGSIHCSGAQG